MYALIGLVVVLLVVDAVLSYRNTRQLDTNAAWVAHTQEVLDLTGEVLLTLVDAENRAAGFPHHRQRRVLAALRGRSQTGG